MATDRFDQGVSLLVETQLEARKLAGTTDFLAGEAALETLRRRVTDLCIETDTNEFGFMRYEAEREIEKMDKANRVQGI